MPGTIILTSTGFDNPSIFTRAIKGRSISETKVTIIMTALCASNDPKAENEKKSYLEYAINQLLQYGIRRTNIALCDIANDSIDELKERDILYVLGGNTFFLLQKIREKKFDIFLRKYLQMGGIYVGASARSNILGSDISIALPYDENICAMTDFSGLKIVPFMTICHADKKDLTRLTDILSKISEPIIKIRDNEAIVIENNILEYIH